MCADMVNVTQMEIAISHAQLLDIFGYFLFFSWCSFVAPMNLKAVNFHKMKPWILKYIWICGNFHVECRIAYTNVNGIKFTTAFLFGFWNLLYNAFYGSFRFGITTETVNAFN